MNGTWSQSQRAFGPWEEWSLGYLEYGKYWIEKRAPRVKIRAALKSTQGDQLAVAQCRPHGGAEHATFA